MRNAILCTNLVYLLTLVLWMTYYLRVVISWVQTCTYSYEGLRCVVLEGCFSLHTPPSKKKPQLQIYTWERFFSGDNTCVFFGMYPSCRKYFFTFVQSFCLQSQLLFFMEQTHFLPNVRKSYLFLNDGWRSSWEGFSSCLVWNGNFWSIVRDKIKKRMINDTRLKQCHL